MDVKLVAEHVKNGHLSIDELPPGKQDEVAAMVKELSKPKKKKK